MFTGIVEAMGTVTSVAEDGARSQLTISTPGWGADLQHGESIAVDGVCLTVAKHTGDEWIADVMRITRELTTLGSVQPGARVNLERAMRADGRFGGHILQGHVDGIATLVARDSQPDWDDLTFEIPEHLARYVVAKGSIALNGTSLTVAGRGRPACHRVADPDDAGGDHLRRARGGRPGERRGRRHRQARRAPAAGASMSDPIVELVERALEDLKQGKPVLVSDSRDRENEADFILSAERATVEWIAWGIRHSSGYLCAPMPSEKADALHLPLMVPRSEDPRRTAYTVSVDAASGITTGISAADRHRTLQVLARPDAKPEDVIRPGHVLPLRAVAGGVLHRPGHTEAAVDLCRLAGLEPVGVIAELVNDDGTMMRQGDASQLAQKEGLVLMTIADLIHYRRAKNDVPEPVEPQPHRVALDGEARLPTQYGEFTIKGFRDERTGDQHVVLWRAPVEGVVPIVRVHSECLTGDAFGSVRCECGPQLHAAMERVAQEGGAVIYLTGHEGRGIGILHKIQAYALQDAGRDTVDANTDLGLPVDRREYGAAAAILHQLGLQRIRLLTNNPAKVEGLRASGIDVAERVALHVGAHPENEAYRLAKIERMGHIKGDDE